MEKTWRWFGKSDPITLEMLRQISVEGLVTALHHIPNGEVWPEEEIRSVCAMAAEHSMRWSVVESLPVCEAIKYAGADRDRLIDNYILSLANLGRCGVKTVCYNFMPVLDWARTDLEHPWPDGSTSLYFDYAQFAYFDINVLRRDGAREDYPENILEKVDELSFRMDEKDDERLIDTIIVRTQGFVNGNISSADSSPLEKFRTLLSLYDGLTADDLRENLFYFLRAIMPVCEKWGIDMCIHPDDPPLSNVFGLPRIITDADAIRKMLKGVDNPRNGLTFCAGSLSAGAGNDVIAMAREFASRTAFVHLRSCDVLPDGNFIEAPHTAGRADLVELCRIFTLEERSRGALIPMRVDHGRNILSDASGGYNPGYGFYGRMFALGQVSGMMASVENEINKSMI